MIAQNQAEQLERVILQLFQACETALEYLSADVLDWGDPQDVCDPESEYAQAARVANKLGAAMEAILRAE